MSMASVSLPFSTLSETVGQVGMNFIYNHMDNFRDITFNAYGEHYPERMTSKMDVYPEMFRALKVLSHNKDLYKSLMDMEDASKVNIALESNEFTAFMFFQAEKKNG